MEKSQSSTISTASGLPISAGESNGFVHPAAGLLIGVIVGVAILITLAGVALVLVVRRRPSQQELPLRGGLRNGGEHNTIDSETGSSDTFDLYYSQTPLVLVPGPDGRSNFELQNVEHTQVPW